MAAKAELDAALATAIEASGRHFGRTAGIDEWHVVHLQTMARQLLEGCAKLDRKATGPYSGKERRSNAR